MNLLFLYTDEQRADTMAAYGNPHIQAPHMDALASRGVVCERAYCTQPVCTPSRGSIHTGLFPHANGAFTNNRILDPNIRCLPEYLPKGKYATAHIGKWHLGDEVFAQHGFEEWISSEDGYHPYYSKGRDPDTPSDYKKFLIRQGFPPVTTRALVAGFSEQFTKAHFVGEETCDFIRRHHHHPFVAYVNFLEPHMPFYGPRNDQYDPDQILLPDNFGFPPGPDQHLKYQLFARAWRRYGFGRLQNIKSEMETAPEVEFPLETEAHWRRVIANYWGLVSMVDATIGRILATLEECGVEEETIVVLTSDHGDMMGSHQMLSKMVQYEESIRVPLVFRIPGRNIAGRRVAEPVSLVDLLPTLMELLGEEVPGGLHGQSLAPTLLEGRPPPSEDVVVEWNGSDSGFGNYDTNAEGVMPHRLMEGVDGDMEKAAVADPIRTLLSREGWKLNVSPSGLGHELYDLHTDPGETRNRITESNAKTRAIQMLDRLRRWQEETGDQVDLAQVSFE